MPLDLLALSLCSLLWSWSLSLLQLQYFLSLPGKEPKLEPAPTAISGWPERETNAR